ncbi:MAG: hypothetical protein QW469_00555 [Candidatus Aenigmatarchaeota archaeon]
MKEIKYTLKTKDKFNEQEKKEIKQIEQKIKKWIGAIFWIPKNTDDESLDFVFRKEIREDVADEWSQDHPEDERDEWFYFYRDWLNYDEYKTENGNKYYYIYHDWM